MPTTTNFGWTTPADTDLVKDGAAAIRTLAGNIDTSLVDLKGGTTGQVLAKASNTDLDFTWSADAGIPATIVDAKGDIIAATAADTVSRLAVGANDTVLTADSSTATGLKWAAAGGGANWSLLNAGGTSLSGSTTTISGISAKDKIMIVVTNASSNTDFQVRFRFNTDSGSNYYHYGAVWGRTNNNGFAQTPQDYIPMAYVAAAAENGFGYLLLTGANASGVKIYQSLGGASDNSGAASYGVGGWYDSSSTISSISVVASAGSFDAGTVYVYTSA
jgi:hypothetical protein